MVTAIRRRLRRWAPGVALIVMVAGWGVGQIPRHTTERSAPAATSASGERSAVQVLAGLPVKGRAPKTGYQRRQFGQAWDDVDRNGCDTRNDILARDLMNTSAKAGTRGCVIASGRLDDPYTGRKITFIRGADSSSAVQIDHVVSLSNAWQTGAQNLDLVTRTRLANDPLNLLAVDGPTNQAKGDGDAATWLPPNKSYRCAYVAGQIAVKHSYQGLWVTSAEKAAMTRVLAQCPHQPLPTR